MSTVPSIRTSGALLLGLAIILTACGGSDGTGPGNNNSGGTYFYRFDANGTRVTFSVQQSLVASFGQNGNQRNAIISGADALRNSAVQILNNATIGTGTYTGYTIDFTSGTVKGVLIHYHDGTVLYQPDASVPITDVVTITELTATTVRGTFNARLKATGRPDLVITNGEFFVQRAN